MFFLFVFFSISWHFCEKKYLQKSWIELATWHNCTVSINFSSWRIWWSRRGHCKPFPVSFRAQALETFGYFAFLIAQNIAWTVICLFLDELIFTLSRIWGLSLGSQSLSPHLPAPTKKKKKKKNPENLTIRCRAEFKLHRENFS